MVCKQKEAKVHLSHIVGDKMQKFDLCEECSKAKGVDDPVGFQLADLLMNLGTGHETELTAEQGALECPHCGFTQADFKKVGRLGCAQCYVTFAEPLEGLLKSMHKGIRHVGKVPRSFQHSRDHAEQLKALQKRLEQAVAAEDFEAAAKLRDQIKLLKAKTESSSTR